MRRGDFNVSLPVDGREDPLGRLGKELTRLGRWLDKRFSEVRRVKEISRQISTGLFTDEVLERVYDSFHHLIPYDRIGCALISEDQLSVRATWAKSNHPDTMKIIQGYRADLAGSSLQTILDTGAPRILNDLEAYLKEHPGSESTRLIVAEGVRSSLTCPLVAEAKPVGFIFFSSREKHTYRPHHQAAFLEIADQLSVLMERSRFYQQIHDLNQQLLEAQHALQEQALRDPLTGVLNHGAIMDSLYLNLDYARRQSEPLSIIMADVDHFKRINDNHGHPTGDAVLKDVVATLQSCLRGHDELGRYGGEEFLMVLRGTPLEVGKQVAERIRAALAARRMDFNDDILRVTLSLGVAALDPERGDGPASLLARADGALYDAKRAGRDCVRTATPAS